MIPAAFAYQRVASIDEALAIIGSDPGAKVLAGGQSLIPLLKLRLGSVETLVDIGRVPGLRGVRQLDDGRLAIGALTTYAELLESPAKDYGVLRDALPHIGDVQVRNLGTIGGAIAHADPASDLPACLLALDAELVIRSASGERTTPVDGFFEGAFTTGLGPGEILTEIRLPGPRDDAGSAYATLQQPASGYALVGVASGGLLERVRWDRRSERRADRGGRDGLPRACGRGRARRLGRLDRFDRRRCRPRDRRGRRLDRHPRRP